MIRYSLMMPLVGVALASAPLGRADDAADARAVVEKGIQALGPADVLAKFKAHTWKTKGKMTMMGQTLPFTCEYMFQEPDRYRFAFDGEFGGQKFNLVVAGADGKAWEQALGQVRDMSEEKLKEFNHQIYMMWVTMLTPLKDPAFKLTLAGETKSLEGQTQTCIKVTRDGKRDISLFFDKNTGLLMRSITRVVDEFAMKEVTQEAIFGDYKKRDGLMQFNKLTLLRDGKPFIEEELFDQKGLEKLDEALLRKP